MKIKIFIYTGTLCLLLAFEASAADLIKTQRKTKRGTVTVYKAPMLDSVVYAKCFEKGIHDISSWDIESSGNRWQRQIFWLTGPGQSYGTPGKTLYIENADRAQFTLKVPILKNNQTAGELQIDAIQLRKFPGWTFFRYTNVPFVYLGTALRVQGLKLGKQQQKLFLTWSDGITEIGGTVPWLGKKPKIPALAYFSRGGNDDNLWEMLVFAPESIRAIETARWKKADDRSNFRYLPAKREILFAIASGKGKNGETAAKDFFKGEAAKIIEALKNVKWETEVDWAMLQNEYDAIAAMLTPSTGNDARKKLESIKTLIGNHEAAKIGEIKSGLAELKKQLSSSGLKNLFD